MKYSIRSLKVAQQNLNEYTGLNVIRSPMASIRTASNTENRCYQGKQTPPQIVINECIP